MQLNFEHIINTLMQSADFPLLTAFVLGLLVAINPCQLAINVSALSYEYKNGKRWIEGLSYALGRTITYTVLGWILMCLIGGGKNIEGVQALLEKAEIAVPYVLIAFGIYMLYRAFCHHHHDGENCHNSGQMIRRNGPLGALVLGMTLALAFCPESAIFYFGIMLPLSISSNVGFLLPLTFGVGASIPVIIMSWIMLKTMDKAKNISALFDNFQQWINAITGILFISIAFILLFID